MPLESLEKFSPGGTDSSAFSKSSMPPVHSTGHQALSGAPVVLCCADVTAHSPFQWSVSMPDTPECAASLPPSVCSGQSVVVVGGWSRRSARYSVCCRGARCLVHMEQWEQWG